MSRSKKGSKPTGYDFWSKRPCSTMGYGPIIKDMTHRVERRINKDIIRNELKEYEKGESIDSPFYFMIIINSYHKDQKQDLQ